nr:tripartite tricarboxylate transporter substrate-binding protein [Ideonella sp. A 288]
MASLAGLASAQAWPARAVTLVVPFAAGGPTDVVARTLAGPIGKALGQPVAVENKVGLGGTLGAGHVMRAVPDGYTFLLHHSGMATAPALYRRLPYNPLTDFEPVSQVVDVPMTLIARKDVPAGSMAELQAHMKAKGDKVFIAHAGVGAASHLCSMVFQQAVGMDLTTMPYQGTAPAMSALLTGQVDLLCDQTTNTTPHLRTGLVRMIGVTTAQRVKTLPDSPTLAEQGLAGIDLVVWHGVYAPKGTPREAIDKFGAALRTALKDPAVLQRLAELGATPAADAKLSPEGLRSWLKQETDRWAPVIKAAGAYAD